MINKSVFLVVSMFGLSACIPNYNTAPYPQGMYGDYSYQQPQQSQQLFGGDLAGAGYSDQTSFDNPYAYQNSQAEVRNSADRYNQRDLYQQNQGYQQQDLLRQDRASYYPKEEEQNPYNSKGILGVGGSLSQVNHSVQQNKDFKLIMPNAWRMAHPSIGKGLELVNQAERFDFNKNLGAVSVREPVDVMIGGKVITIIGLRNSSTPNVKGFLCKDVYLLQANNSEINKMWGKFCRHPNWNEWVLSQW